MRPAINRDGTYPDMNTRVRPLRDRDRILMQDLSEVLGSHASLRGLPLEYVVSGGVVHLDGRVDSPEIRSLVRRVAARVRGIHAVWDTMIAGQETGLKIVDIGCGTHKQIPWAIGVDRQALPGVDIVTDLETSLPFRDDDIDQVYAIHVLEHVLDIVRLMNDIHRCLKPAGILHIMVPNCDSPNAVADPTHVRLFNSQVFKYFCMERPGLRLFRPLVVSGDQFNLLADLEPVKSGESPATTLELSRFFD